MMKKKNRKKLIVALGTVCLTALLICLAGISKNEDSSAKTHVYAKPPEQAEQGHMVLTPTDREQEFFDNQSDSVDSYNKMLDSFDSSSSSPFSLNQSRIAGERKYPDYYGGAYIDDETGGLVVLVKNSSLGLSSAATKIAAATQETTVISSESVKSGIRIESCEVSYAELLEGASLVEEQMDNLRSQGVNIVMVGPDIKLGKVVVSIEDLTEEKEEKVRKLLDCPFLQFENGKPARYLEAIGGGKVISSAHDGATSSICFAAKRTGRYGFVISGHAGDFLNEQFRYKNTALGSVGRTAFYSGTKADAAFLVANPGVTVTNVINQSAVVGGMENDLPEGALVYMQGGYSGRQGGKVLRNNICVSSKSDNMEFRNQTIISISAQPGDSGSPILFFTKGQYYICGIAACETETGKAFSPFRNIIQELGVSFVPSTVRVPGYK